MQTPSLNTKSVLVIGAGVIGTTVALRLLKAGRKVILVDRDAPGSGCSSGNAGYISETGIIPAAAMAGLTKLPKMLRDPDGPLVIRPGYLPKFFPWAVAAALNNRPARVREIIAGQAALTRHAVKEWAHLLSEINGQHLIDCKGAIIAFRTAAALEERMKRVPVWIEHGMTVNRITSEQVLELEPALIPNIAGGLYFPKAARTIDPKALTEHVAQQFQMLGGELIQGKAKDLIQGMNGWDLKLEDGRTLKAHEAVVSCGRWSDDLLKPLGYRFLLEAERGYHLMLPEPGVKLNRPVSLGEGNFAVTPMQHGIRLAGTAEFAGTDAPMNPARSRMLFGLAAPYFPGLSDRNATEWMGHRPSLPDMLPAIGKATRHTGLYYSFGHNHSGLTQAAISARLLTEIILGKQTVVDPSPYSLTRFRGSR